MELRREQFTADQAERIYIEIDCADLAVRMTDGPEVKIEAEVEEGITEWHCQSANGRLEIYYELNHGKKHLHWNQKAPRIIIEIPRDHVFGEFTMELGAGNADLREVEICCDRMHIETGAGNFKTGSITASEAIKIEVGAGNAMLGNVKTKMADVDCGVGQLVMNGKVEAELNVNCGVGKCELNLEGQESDYSYDISCGIGKVSINGNSVNGMGGSQQQYYTEAKGRIKVACGLGKVMIRIA